MRKTLFMLSAALVLFVGGLVSCGVDSQAQSTTNDVEVVSPVTVDTASAAIMYHQNLDSAPAVPILPDATYIEEDGNTDEASLGSDVCCELLPTELLQLGLTPENSQCRYSKREYAIDNKRQKYPPSYTKRPTKHFASHHQVNGNHWRKANRLNHSWQTATGRSNQC